MKKPTSQKTWLITPQCNNITNKSQNVTRIPHCNIMNNESQNAANNTTLQQHNQRVTKCN